MNSRDYTNYLEEERKRKIIHIYYILVENLFIGNAHQNDKDIIEYLVIVLYKYKTYQSYISYLLMLQILFIITR